MATRSKTTGKGADEASRATYARGTEAAKKKAAELKRKKALRKKQSRP